MLRLSKIMILRSLTLSIMFTLVFAALSTQSISSNKISTANGESESYSGDYDGDISIMYFE